MAISASKSNDYVKEYSEYLAKRKAIEDGFSKLSSFDVAPLIGSIIGNGNLASLMNQTKISLKVGVDGNFSICASNISARIKLCVLASVDVQDKLSYNVKGTSLFTKSKGEITSVELKRYSCLMKMQQKRTGESTSGTSIFQTTVRL